MNAENVVDSFNRLQIFIRDACPSNWLTLGEELRDAAEKLWENSSEGFRLDATLDEDQHLVKVDRFQAFSRPYLLLAGFATENVMKGLLVALAPSNVTAGTLSRELKSHNLLKLAAKLDEVDFTQEELKFCRIASAAIPYWGRYPIPLESNSVSPEIALTQSLRNAFLGLFERLARKLYWTVRDGWDSGAGPVTLQLRNASYEAIDTGTPLVPSPRK